MYIQSENVLYTHFIFLRISSPNPFVGKCPKCGNNIVLKKSFYGCSNYPECKFTLAEHFRKKKLTKTNVKELLEGKETLVKGIKNKEKKPYNAVVKIGEKGYKIIIFFISVIFIYRRNFVCICHNSPIS